jgi:hypothetical protein
VFFDNDRRLYDYHVTQSAGLNVMRLTLSVIFFWFFIFLWLWRKNRVLGIAYIGVFIWMFASIQPQAKTELPRCMRLNNCDFTSRVPLREQ